MIRDENTGRFITGSQMVAENISHRIKLITGEYPRDITAGIDWANILGTKDTSAAGSIIKSVIIDTSNVLQILDFEVELNNRVMEVRADILTEYGTITITEPIGA